MNRYKAGPLAALLLALLALAAAPASAQTKLLRFPDIHGELIAFSYAGDLWTVSSSGGTARRLTAHPGLELFPKFSPDGQWIAFTGQYDGDEQVYVIPTAGGVPKQLTYYPARGPLPARWGYDHHVYGWTVDGKAVLFRSTREYWGPSQGRLYTVPVAGGLPAALAMPLAGAGDFSPDGRRVVYSPLFRDFRTWKRYQGGWAQDLYVFDPATAAAERITDHARTDRDPMWIGDSVYFASDRDGTLNIHVFELASQATKQLTRSTQWDVRWPSSDGKGQIVYELNGELQVLDTASGASRAVSISVPDDGLAKRPARVSAEKQIENFGLSPKGERALFVARGDVFTTPIEKGPTRNLTNSSNAHDKWARWSPDGKQIAFISDRSGEEELYLIAQDGSGEPEQLTKDGRAMRYAPEWAPDGKRLAFSDKDGKLYVLSLADRKLTEIADESRGQVQHYRWSPDSGHLAFSLSVSSRARAVYIWSTSGGETRRITGETFDAYQPVWGAGGDYLYFLSDRTYPPQISNSEWNFATSRQTGIFALALRKDVADPFPPESDEVDAKKDGKDEEKTEDEKKTKDEAKTKTPEPKPVRIDFEGLAERVARVPVEADNYDELAAKQGHLLYVKRGAFYYGRPSAIKPSLQIFSLEDRKQETLAEEIDAYALSADGSKVLVQHDESYALYDAKPKAKDSKKAVSTKGLKVDRVPAQEWATIFDEVWRRNRDFFYVENMHGYDWEALRDQYRPLLAHVAHRADLNYLIGEMIAELNVGHTYIWGGDYEVPARAKVALPGASFELDAAAGRYRIADILPGQNEEEIYRSPLTAIGVEAKVGDYVLAIDGEELHGDDNPYRLLRHKADRPVKLTLNSKPEMQGARSISYEPITDESDLRYLAWVTHNRRRVAEATDGRVGYLHMPDMGGPGIREFIKWFYPQIRKQGLVVDVRGNGGGNVSQMIIERLRRTPLGTRFSRNSDEVGLYPVDAFYGHLVCLVNEDSASDGDIFPARFRDAGLGPLIGKRTWGGVVGVTNRGSLLDGGSVYVPEFGTNAMTGEWIIEGIGVPPDIEIENDAQSVIEGGDPQLERGIEEILKKLKEDPKELPSRPADPVKTK